MSKRKLALIQPRDRRAQDAHHSSRSSCWSRIKDYLSGKGPDIFVGYVGRKRQNTRKDTPHSQWHRYWSAREDGRLYDHRTRRYEFWHAGMWLDARYCHSKKHQLPLIVTDAFGANHDFSWYHVDPDGYIRCQ